MLLGIFSDSHLGFGSLDRYEEAFNRFDESIKIFKDKSVDYILHAGDLFDHSTPHKKFGIKQWSVLIKMIQDYQT